MFAMVCYSLCIALNIWRYFERSSPETNVNKMFVKDPVGFNATKKTMPMAFGLKTAQAVHFIDPTIYQATATHITRITQTVDGKVTVKQTQIPLTLISCGEIAMDPKYFSNVDLSQMYCIKEFEDPKFKLEISGEFESEKLAYINLVFKPCIGAGCKTQAEIESKLKKSYFAVNYIGQAIKSSNYSEPVEKFPTAYFTTTSTSFSKEVQFRFSDQRIETQASPFGYVIPETMTFTAPNKVIENLAEIAQPGQFTDRILAISFRMLQEKTVTTRAYKTAFQYLAELGGLFNVITVVTLIITSRVRNVLLTLDLASLFKAATSHSKSSDKTIICRQTSAAKKSSAIKPSPLVESPSVNSHSITNNGAYPMTSIKSGNFKRAPIFTPKPQNSRVEESKKQLKARVLGQNSPSVVVIRDEPAAHLDDIKQPDDFEQFDMMDRESVGDKQHERLDPTLKSQPVSINGLERDNAQDLEVLVLKSKALAAGLDRNSSPSHSDLQKVSMTSVMLKGFAPFFLPKNSRLKEVSRYTQESKRSLFDYSKLVEALSEIQKLKRLLMDADQLELFDAITADRVGVLCAGSDPNCDGSSQRRIDAYLNICSKPKLDTIDQNMILLTGYMLDEYRVKK